MMGVEERSIDYHTLPLREFEEPDYAQVLLRFTGLRDVVDTDMSTAMMSSLSYDNVYFETVQHTCHLG